MLKRLVSHTAIYGLSPQIVKVAQVLVLPLITPFLSPTDYGIFGLITAVVGAVSVFSTLGLNIVLANSFTRSPSQFKWLWRQIYGFLNLWSWIYSLIVSVIIYLFIPKEAQHHTLEIILLNVIPLVLFAPSINIGSLYYQLKQKPFQIAVRGVVAGLLTIICNIVFIKYLKLGYMGWFYSGAISQLLLQFSYYIPLNYKEKITPIYNFKWRTIINQLKICLPTIPHYYSAYILGSFDRILMKSVGIPVSDIGKYNAAQTPVSLLNSIVLAANKAVSPMLLNSYKDDNRVIEKKLNYNIIIVTLTLSTILCLFMKETLPLVIRSKGLENIYPVAIILIMSYNYRPMYVAANNRLFYLEKTKSLLKVTLIAAIISVILNVVLLYFVGYIGAAIATFISYMYMGYSGFFIKEFKIYKGTNHKPIFWLILTIVLTGFCYVAVEFNPFFKFFISIIILIACIISLYKINK